MAEKAKEHIAGEIAVLEQALPADVRERPIAELAPAEALGRAALSGLHQLIRIIETPLDMGEHTDALKQRRLIGDMALGAGKLYMRAAEGAFKARETSALVELLNEVRKAQAEKKG